MSLKFELESLEGMDEGVTKLYTEKDGKFYLDVDGAVSKSTVTEFRDKNIGLMKQLDDFKDVDLNKYKELLDKSQEIDAKKMMPASEIETQVSERVKGMKTDFDTKYTELTGTNKTLTKQLEVLLIDSAVRAAATVAKVSPEGTEDVLLRAKAVFRIEDGVAIPYDGESVKYGKDGKSPQTLAEWIGDLSKSASHQFMSSTGSGAQHRRGPGKIDTSKLNANQKIKAGLEASG